MRTHRIQGRVSGPLVAVFLGVLGGLALLALTRFEFALGGPKIDRSGRLVILINGIPERMARDVLLPNHAWVLQIRLPEETQPGNDEAFLVTLRSERTGATIQIEDRFSIQNGIATLAIPKSIGLATGLLSVRAAYIDATGRHFEDQRRIRIRSWFGGSPIGERQIIHFDFEVDRDEDGVPDFLKDLERFGLASPDQRDFAERIAARIEERALERVERAYDATDDPNGTGRDRDPVHVRFRPDTDPRSLITRICIGGSDPLKRGSVGQVRFDLRNEDKTSVECGDEPVSGIFPAELEIYKDSPLYRAVLDPFLKAHGGTVLGKHPDDSISMFEIDADGSGNGSVWISRRRSEVDRAIAVIGDVLGSIMAHEAGHALGLVAPSQPGLGLFGGSDGEAYAHNLDAFGDPPSDLWLMNPGGRFSFEELAGQGVDGPLRFRPLNYAYLRDRVVVSDKH